VGFGSVVQAGRRMFLVGRGGTTMSLGWGIEGWRRHAPLPAGREIPVLTWTGRRIVAYLPRAAQILSLDPRASAWVRHPMPGFASSRTGALLHTGRQLFVFNQVGIEVLGDVLGSGEAD
jgi:hypothetical protein